MAVESESSRKLIAVRSRAREILKAVEPLRENIDKFNLVASDSTDLLQSGLYVTKPDVEQLQKHLKAIIYKLDPLLESVCAMVEDTTPPLTAATATTCDSTGSCDIPRTDIQQSLPGQAKATSTKLTDPKIAEPSNPTPSQIKSIQPSSHASTTRPNKSSAKKPPPGMVKRAPPVKSNTNQATVVPKAFQPDLTKIDTDLMPEQIPNAKLLPKPILWLGIVKSKIPGSVWENLLAEDKNNMAAKEVAEKIMPNCPSDTNWHVNDNTLQGSDGFANFRFNVNFSMLDQLFFENEDDKLRGNDKKTSLADAAASAGKTRVRTVLEPKKTQLIEISIKGLGLDDNVEAIKVALNNLIFDEDSGTSQKDSAETVSTCVEIATPARRKPWGLTIDRLERLLASYPTPEEASSLRVLKENCEAESKSSGESQKIASADRFLITLLEIKHFQERASACLTRLTFDRELNSITEKLTKFSKTVDEVNIAIGYIRPILALIVKMGNYINCRTRKSVVSGIQLSSLGGLKQVRSVDGSTTFLKSGYCGTC